MNDVVGRWTVLACLACATTTCMSLDEGIPTPDLQPTFIHVTVEWPGWSAAAATLTSQPNDPTEPASLSGSVFGNVLGGLMKDHEPLGGPLLSDLIDRPAVLFLRMDPPSASAPPRVTFGGAFACGGEGDVWRSRLPAVSDEIQQQLGPTKVAVAMRDDVLVLALADINNQALLEAASSHPDLVDATRRLVDGRASTSLLSISVSLHEHFRRSTLDALDGLGLELRAAVEEAHGNSSGDLLVDIDLQSDERGLRAVVTFDDLRPASGVSLDDDGSILDLVPRDAPFWLWGETGVDHLPGRMFQEAMAAQLDLHDVSIEDDLLPSLGRDFVFHLVPPDEVSTDPFRGAVVLAVRDPTLLEEIAEEHRTHGGTVPSEVRALALDEDLSYVSFREDHVVHSAWASAVATAIALEDDSLSSLGHGFAQRRTRLPSRFQHLIALAPSFLPLLVGLGQERGFLDDATAKDLMSFVTDVLGGLGQSDRFIFLATDRSRTTLVLP